MNPSIAYSQRTNNYHVINQVQVSSKKIKIAYDIVKDGRVESYTLVSAEKARPEFYEAMHGLCSHVASLLEIDYNGVEERVHPKNVKFGYNGQGKMSAVIDADFTLPLGKTSVGIRTPQKQEPIDSEVDIDEKYFFFPSTVDQLRLVQDEAEKFILGERAQGQLFSNDKK